MSLSFTFLIVLSFPTFTTMPFENPLKMSYSVKEVFTGIKMQKKICEHHTASVLAVKSHQFIVAGVYFPLLWV